MFSSNESQQHKDSEDVTWDRQFSAWLDMLTLPITLPLWWTDQKMHEVALKLALSVCYEKIESFCVAIKNVTFFEEKSAKILSHYLLVLLRALCTSLNFLSRDLKLLVRLLLEFSLFLLELLELHFFLINFILFLLKYSKFYKCVILDFIYDKVKFGLSLNFFICFF